MILLDSPYVGSAAWFLAGALIGYWLLRWKDRNLRAVHAIKEQAILENARRQAENISREARLQANEEALKLREETERSFVARRQTTTEAEKRLVERKALINRQLEHMVLEEKSVREQQLEYKKKSQDLETRHHELAGLIQQRREALQSFSHLSEAEARQLLMKEVELESLQDASNLTRRILDECSEPDRHGHGRNPCHAESGIGLERRLQSGQRRCAARGLQRSEPYQHGRSDA